MGKEGVEKILKRFPKRKEKVFILDDALIKIVSLVLKPEKDRSQLSFLEGNDFEYFYFVTNTNLSSEKVVIAYTKRSSREKRGIAKNYINTLKGHREAKYDMAVGCLLLKSFWANEAIFQLMMLSYNLLLLFELDFLGISEFRQQINTFRLKYVFLPEKIIITARYVVLKLPEKYPFRDVYEKCMA